MVTIPAATDLNLDAMTPEDLQAFADACGPLRCRRAAARQLFPHRPPGYCLAANLLGAYAWNKLTAMRQRAQGNITVANVYDMICDRIYTQLPDWARGW